MITQSVSAQDILREMTGEWSAGKLLGNADPRLVTLHALWHSVSTATAGLPSASTLNPRVLKDVLPFVHVYDTQAEPGTFKPRLIGTRISENLSQDIRIKSLEELGDKARDVLLILRATQLARQPIHVRARRVIELMDNIERTLESLWLPSTSDGKTLDRITAITLAIRGD